ncbi:MAG TPA: transcription initiation factor IIB [bacterium]|nr:transcription initiation factor IIB [bacterium]
MIEVVKKEKIIEKIIIEEVPRCPECGSTSLKKDPARGEIYCENCGLVVEENLIDFGPEWRAFDYEQQQKRSRIGPPLTFTKHDKGLSTEIGWENKDFSGRPISPKSRFQLRRMRKWQRLMESSERSLIGALKEIHRMASVMSLPRNVQEVASLIYRKAVSKNLIWGRRKEGIAAAALYAACRQYGVPRTLNEIEEVSGVSRKIIGRYFRVLCSRLKLKLPSPSPRDYVPRFCSQLHVSRKVYLKAIEIINEVEKKGLFVGKAPAGLAATAIYIASILCGEKKTQKEISNVSGVTEVTIRSRYKEMVQELGLEIDIS